MYMTGKLEEMLDVEDVALGDVFVPDLLSFSAALEMSAGNAKIGHPAPQFKVTAVVDGQFKDVQLSDYRGTQESSEASHRLIGIRLYFRGCEGARRPSAPSDAAGFPSGLNYELAGGKSGCGNSLSLSNTHAHFLKKKFVCLF